MPHNKYHQQHQPAYAKCHAKLSDLRACKKICANDILPMTLKGNYHGHKLQINKRNTPTASGASSSRISHSPASRLPWMTGDPRDLIIFMGCLL